MVPLMNSKKTRVYKPMRFDIADTCIREDRMRVIFESRKPLSKIANLSDRKFRRGNIKLSFAIPYVINQQV